MQIPNAIAGPPRGHLLFLNAQLQDFNPLISPWLGLMGKIWIFHLWSLLLAPSTFLLPAPRLSSEAQAYAGISGREHSSRDVSSVLLITGFFLGRGS